MAETFGENAAMPMKCQVVTQERLVFEGEVDSIVARSESGEMCILPGHEPLIAVLTIDELRIRSDGQESLFAVGGGIVKIDHDAVTILANTAEAAYEIDAVRAEEARKRSLAAIERIEGIRARQVQATAEEAERIQQAMNANIAAYRRAATRLEVITKAGEGTAVVEND
jgi:F-type H+-transporting ATPase subunit epsilon